MNDSAEVGTRKFCVLYMVDGVERRSPWFTSRVCAAEAHRILLARFGKAIVYID